MLIKNNVSYFLLHQYKKVFQYGIMLTNICCKTRACDFWEADLSSPGITIFKYYINKYNFMYVYIYVYIYMYVCIINYLRMQYIWYIPGMYFIKKTEIIKKGAQIFDILSTYFLYVIKIILKCNNNKKSVFVNR